MIRSHYGNGFLKQYVRDHLCLRTEPATNDVTDYGVKKAVENLPQLRDKFSAISSGATLDFLLSAKQDAAAAKRFMGKALGRQNHPVPRVINTDGHSACPPAVVRLKAEGALDEDCRRRPVPYLNNVLEQDHRAIKRRVNASQHFRSFWGTWRTIAGYEAIHMIRKDQACWSEAVAKVGLLHRFILGLFAATN